MRRWRAREARAGGLGQTGSALLRVGLVLGWAVMALVACSGPADEGGGDAGACAGDACADDSLVTGDCAKEAPPGAQCNPYCQTGCPAQRQCALVGATFQCVGVGDGQVGDACVDAEGCLAGVSCFSIQGEPEQRCRKPCVGDADCPDGRTCNLSVSFGDGTAVTFCGELTATCDLFAADDGCSEGARCTFSQQASSAKCMAPGTLGQGDLCWGLAPGACGPGLQCVVACVPVCSTDGAGVGEPKCAESCEGPSLEVSAPHHLGICVGAEPPAQCDLWSQTGCPAGQACFPVTGGIACLAPGDVDDGQSCAFMNSCHAGSACVGGVCRPLCDAADVDGPNGCATRCEASGVLNPAAWNLGVCTAP